MCMTIMWAGVHIVFYISIVLIIEVVEFIITLSLCIAHMDRTSATQSSQSQWTKTSCLGVFFLFVLFLELIFKVLTMHKVCFEENIAYSITS